MINEISANLPQKILVTKITTSFDKHFGQLIMNNRFEAAKFEPEPTFEKTINDIKNNHLKFIASATMNISSITSFDKKIEEKLVTINSKTLRLSEGT